MLVSKVGAERDQAGALVPAQRPAELRTSVEANLASLGTDHLDVVNLRRLDVSPGLKAEGDQKVDLDSQLAELTALRDEGKIGGIGLSGVGTAQIEQAQTGLAADGSSPGGGVACVQNSYSVLDRASEPVLDVCRKHGIAWVPFFPLGSAGFPGYASVTGHPAVVAAAESLGVTPAQVGLAWLLASYEGTLLIPGTADPAHLADNIAAGRVRLSPDIVADLGRCGAEVIRHLGHRAGKYKWSARATTRSRYSLTGLAIVLIVSAMDMSEVLMTIATPEGRADPYPLYAALHEMGEAVEAGTGEVLVVGYDAINSVLRDPGFRVSDAGQFELNFPGWRDHPVFVQGADWILNLNAPDHARIRSLIARAFTARRINGLEPAIAAIADELLDAMADRGADGSPVEFMQNFAYLLPVTVICELIGIPEADRAGFRPLAHDLAGVFEVTDADTLPAINTAAIELLAYFTGLAARRRVHPRDDLLSDLVTISDSGGGRLTGAELLHNLTLLLVAGFETTTNLLGNGLQIVLNDPAAGDAVRDGSVSPAAFVEEVLRFDSPVQLTSRIGYDTKVGGVMVSAGAGVTTLLGAGNWDPRRFAEPGRFDPLRTDGGPLSFGGGAHFCIGAALARLEGRVAFGLLLNRFPKITAAGDPVRRDRLVLRGFEELPVSVS